MGIYKNIVTCIEKKNNITVTGTRQQIEEMRNLSNSLDDKIQQSENLRSNLRDKLGKLKQSIREAREEANKVQSDVFELYFILFSSSVKCVQKNVIFVEIFTPPFWQYFLLTD